MAPCGTAIMPAQFVDDVDDLRIRLWVNEELMIDARTSGMLFKCDEIVTKIGEHITLGPGDIVFTGSPSEAHLHPDQHNYRGSMAGLYHSELVPNA